MDRKSNIPQFPEFRVVGVEDREAVEAHTHRYPPYSDFNFTSLWAWDTSEERMISELNGNLVVRFTDYATNEPFLSFLGSNETEHTARTLIDYCKAQGLSEKLKLMPEVSTQGMRFSVLQVEEDRDNFDYILDVPSLSRLENGSFKDLRRNVRKFSFLYPKLRMEVGEMDEQRTRNHILTLLGSWEADKITKGKEFDICKERKAITRLLESMNNHKLMLSTVADGDSLIAFSIEEVLPGDYCMGHFWKADTQKTGIYDYLLHSIARNLNNRGITSWNFEQDLGIGNLRQSKMGYRPKSFLKKFTVSVSRSSQVL